MPPMRPALNCITFIALCVIALAHSSQGLSVVVKYPDANVGSQSMTLRGDGCGLSWNSDVALIRTSPNTYFAQIVCSDGPITLQMKPLVGGTWSNGANYRVAVGKNETKSVTIYPFFYSKRGSYSYLRNACSQSLDNCRSLVIYTPPSYQENPLRPSYPTLFMHDGQNLFNGSTAFGGQPWDCQDTIDTQVLSGQMEEIIVVGVDNTPDRINELTYSYDPTEQAGGKGDIYLDFIENVVFPMVKSKYRVTSDQKQRGILGSSLGGLISCYAGWTRPSVYSRTGCMSSSFWWNSQDFDTTILVKNPRPDAKWQSVFYLDSGDQGPLQDDLVQTQTVLSHMQTLGFTLNSNLFYYLDHGASHNEYWWGRRFWAPMQALFPSSTLIPA